MTTPRDVKAVPSLATYVCMLSQGYVITFTWRLKLIHLWQVNLADSLMTGQPASRFWWTCWGQRGLFGLPPAFTPGGLILSTATWPQRVPLALRLTPESGRRNKISSFIYILKRRVGFQVTESFVKASANHMLRLHLPGQTWNAQVLMNTWQKSKISVWWNINAVLLCRGEEMSSIFDSRQRRGSELSERLRSDRAANVNMDGFLFQIQQVVDVKWRM